MSEKTVLPSLARVVRGLVLLFWGVPALLLTTTACALDLGWRQFGYAPTAVASASLVAGLFHLRRFQARETVWVNARHRATFLALLLAGLSPTPVWWNRAPEEVFFANGMVLLSLAGVAFLIAVNDVLLRLAAMLPDQALRSETLFFTRLNSRGLMVIGLFVLLWLGLPYWDPAPEPVVRLRSLLEFTRPWLFIMVLLPPVALTMTLLWKIKEAILHSVFRA
jgi:hypothetical protein